MLDILASLNSTHDLAERRPRIEHTQIIKADDVVRLGKLGGFCLAFYAKRKGIWYIRIEVIPSVQPTHACVRGHLTFTFWKLTEGVFSTSDMWYAESRLVSYSLNNHLTLPDRGVRLWPQGTARLKDSYVYRSLLEYVCAFHRLIDYSSTITWWLYSLCSVLPLKGIKTQSLTTRLRLSSRRGKPSIRILCGSLSIVCARWFTTWERGLVSGFSYRFSSNILMSPLSQVSWATPFQSAGPQGHDIRSCFRVVWRASHRLVGTRETRRLCGLGQRYHDMWIRWDPADKGHRNGHRRSSCIRFSGMISRPASYTSFMSSCVCENG